MGEEETNLLCRRIPNKLCRYSILKVMEHSSFLLKCGLHTVTFFQRVQYRQGKERVTLQWRSLDKHHLHPGFKVNVNIDKIY